MQSISDPRGFVGGGRGRGGGVAVTKFLFLIAKNCPEGVENASNFVQKDAKSS